MSVIKQDRETELYIDGEFVASWRLLDISDKDLGIICNMIDHAVGYGESKKAKEIRKVLEIRGG